MKILYSNILVLIIYGLFCLNAYAIKNDDFLNISSDNLKLENDKNLAIFTGNVLVEFEGIRLKTDIIKVTFSKTNNTNRIEKIEIPHKFWAVNSCENEAVIADTGLYDANKKTLSFNQNVIMKKDNYILRTDHFTYYNVALDDTL